MFIMCSDRRFVPRLTLELSSSVPCSARQTSVKGKGAASETGRVTCPDA